MRFVFFTRTMWDEPPRLRKQVAQLLLSHGHEVHFFQKRKLLKKWKTEKISDQLTLYSCNHLLHQQLKIFRLLNRIDAEYLQFAILSLIDIREDDIIINFAYDFFFLRELYPHNPIIHIVNDDYVAMARKPNKRAAARLLAQSCRDADHNLTVSYKLEKELKEYSPCVDLFLPWARHAYQPPLPGQNRNEMLYWGFINERIDFDVVADIMNAGIRINFVGPMLTPSKEISVMLAHANAHYHGVKSLQDIPEIMMRCCCSLLPYNEQDSTLECVTMNNRGFELLGFGLPLLYKKLPYLLRAPHNVIYPCLGAQQFIDAYKSAKNGFYDTQPSIQNFLKNHQPETRYQQLMTILGNRKEKF